MAAAAGDDDTEWCMTERRHAIVRSVHRQNARVVLLRRSEKVKMGKVRFSVKNAIGLPYGSRFDVVNGELQQVDYPEAEEDDLLGDEAGDDNRTLDDRTEHQRLSFTEIQALKDQGLEGQALIEKLVESSATFAQKTSFSQSKYLKKKRRQHMKQVVLHRPTLRLLHDFYFVHAPLKICYLRPDMLSQILLRADIRPGSRILLFETCHGLVAGALTQMLGGDGCVLQLHAGSQAGQSAVDALDLPAKTRSALLTYNIQRFATIVNEAGGRASGDAGAASAAEAESKPVDPLLTTKQGSERARTANRAEQEARRGNFDALVLVGKMRPEPVLQVMLGAMAGSRPVVVHSLYQEALLECMTAMRGRCTNFGLLEMMTREYQVLPMRTHPTMTTDACSGSLLHGTTVAAVRPSQAVGGSAASSASTAAASATDGEKPSKRAKPSPSADTDTDTATAEMEAVAEVVAAEPADHADSTEH